MDKLNSDSGSRTAPASILVLGCEGMLGHKMFQTLAACFPGTRGTIFGALSERFYGSIPLFAPDRIIERVNVMDFTALRETLVKARPDYIINCIGIVKQREEASAAIPSITINSLLPHLLAAWAAAWSGRLIHFSTDCVFSGKKGGYSEADPSDAEDLYGKSKFLGEVIGAANALTLRTSIIGRELAHFQSLLEWFLAQGGKQVKGFRRVIYAGVTTNYISELVMKLIMKHPGLSGLFQVTAPAISKHDLLCRLRTAYDLDVEIIPDDREVSDRSMTGERFLRATGFSEPTWDDLIGQLAADATPYEMWLKEKRDV
ncbi:MAG: SDR family oxidoreductase [candidate division Zixibacteria bacterium]|nr:SDR family oxidoreductase [candidate division Zixibacteria bacterium]